MLNFKMQTTNRNPGRCQLKDFSIMTEFIHTLMYSKGKKKKPTESVLCKIQLSKKM